MELVFRELAEVVIAEILAPEVLTVALSDVFDKVLDEGFTDVLDDDWLVTLAEVLAKVPDEDFTDALDEVLKRVADEDVLTKMEEVCTEALSEVLEELLTRVAEEDVLTEALDELLMDTLEVVVPVALDVLIEAMGEVLTDAPVDVLTEVLDEIPRVLLDFLLALDDCALEVPVFPEVAEVVEAGFMLLSEALAELLSDSDVINLVVLELSGPGNKEPEDKLVPLILEIVAEMLCVVDGVAGGELPGELEPMEMMVDILVVELITEREEDPAGMIEPVLLKARVEVEVALLPEAVEAEVGEAEACESKLKMRNSSC